MIPTCANPPTHGGRVPPRDASAAPHARRPWRASLLLALLIAGFLAGCVEERSSIDLQRVPMPEGGSVYTVAVLDGDPEPSLVAPSHAGLFIHHSDRGAWEHIQPRSQDALRQQRLGQPNDEALTPARRALNFRPSELFTAHDSRLWLAPGVSETGTQEFLTSEDLGRTWSRTPLPIIAAQPEDPPDEPETSDAPDAGSDTQDERPPSDQPAPDGPTDETQPPAEPTLRPNPAHLRFVNTGELGFYLMGANNLWKLKLPADAPLRADAQPEELWENISLRGAQLDDDSNRTKLPYMLRHYLPAAPQRPYEMLTMLRERLHIYRRDAGEPKFKEVAVLDGADSQLATVPGTNLVLILTSEGLFKSEDDGKTWNRLTWYSLTQDDTQGQALQVLAATPDHPATLLLALEDGAIYRSDDLGEKFTEVRPPDLDLRGVVDFAYSRKHDRVWAATNGAGVLRSLDRGKTWQNINDELRATRASDIGADESDAFLLGTDAGLYRLAGRPESGQWQMLQPRAITAIRVEHDSGAILSGTTTGAIVRLETSGKSSVSQAAPSAPTGATAFRAPRFRGMDLPPRAIVAIEAHPDNPQVYAWSAHRGPLTSLDSGVSWTSLALNPAFESALEGSYISNFTTEVGERIYLVTRGLNPSAPTQLWRSYNNGETWHAVSSLERGPRPSDVFLAHNPSLSPENVFMAHRNRFARSLDGGSSWRDLRGPWSDGEILLYELIDDKHLLIVESFQTTYLVLVTDTEQERPSFRNYQLNWPKRRGIDRADIHNISVQGGYFFLSTDRGLYTGKVPDEHQRLPNGLAVLITIISVALLTLLGFGIMRATA
ncbi:hypothetical protein [Bradymonas sediminis]|uniref:hypothetical protein n=1 Tax=Bradymonas sediminis TaxID=1548548 RepID=UPI001060B345|nr:hypothetical protein [Bradymonas sediminis]TDP63699.1 hypothetical protein DFR33_110157 [Bradymonas sediminis]